MLCHSICVRYYTIRNGNADKYECYRSFLLKMEIKMSLFTHPHAYAVTFTIKQKRNCK